MKGNHLSFAFIFTA